MEFQSEYVGLLVTFLMAVGIAAAVLFLNQILGPKNKLTPEKAEPYECGMPSTARPTHFSIKFYLFAMLFILFDVEIVWFFPWAVILRELGAKGLVEMFVFVAVLVLGYVYAWRKGALEWER